MKKYLILALTAVMAVGSLTACENTMRGAGQDVERAGENMQRNAGN